MKDIKNGMKAVRLSDEKKQDIIDSVINSGNSPAKRTDLRTVGIISSAAALVLIALAAVVFSALPGRDDGIVLVSENSSEHSVQKGQTSASSLQGGTEPAVSVQVSSLEPSSTPSEIITEPIPAVSEPSQSEESSAGQSTQPEPSVTEPSSQPEPSITEPSAQPEPSVTEPSSQPEPQISEGKAPMKTVSLIVPDETELREYAGDMHRPAGYNMNIGSGLALKMEITKGSGMRYAVIIRRMNIDDLLKALGTYADDTGLSAVTVNGAPSPRQNVFFARLTAEQIISLAENGARLSYVGSGRGDIGKADFDTPEGIENYVDLLGDEYAFDGDEIRAYPDIIDG